GPRRLHSPSVRAAVHRRRSTDRRRPAAASRRGSRSTRSPRRGARGARSASVAEYTITSERGAFLKPRPKLSTAMTVTEFDHGYWYATQLKQFAKAIGIPLANKLRKDELEKAITLFLETGRVKSPTRRRLSNHGPKDVERGLSLDLPVSVYTNDKE